MKFHQNSLNLWKTYNGIDFQVNTFGKGIKLLMISDGFYKNKLLNCPQMGGIRQVNSPIYG